MNRHSFHSLSASMGAAIHVKLLVRVWTVFSRRAVHLCPTSQFAFLHFPYKLLLSSSWNLFRKSSKPLLTPSRLPLWLHTKILPSLPMWLANSPPTRRTVKPTPTKSSMPPGKAVCLSLTCHNQIDSCIAMAPPYLIPTNLNDVATTAPSSCRTSISLTCWLILTESESPNV